MQRQTKEEGITEIEKLIDVRDKVVMHNYNKRGFVYAILSQLNPEK
jgi:hypothetical protein